MGETDDVLLCRLSKDLFLSFDRLYDSETLLDFMKLMRIKIKKKEMEMERMKMMTMKVLKTLMRTLPLQKRKRWKNDGLQIRLYHLLEGTNDRVENRERKWSGNH